MASQPTELVIRLRSYTPWKGEMWERLLPQLEVLVQTPLTCLDERDPPRRKVDGGKGQGAYLSVFRDRASSIQPSGEFGKSGIWFMLTNNRWPSRIANEMSFFIPEKATTKLGLGAVEAVFDALGKELAPFFMVSDVEAIVYSRKPSPPNSHVHHSFELSGVHWLTYFGPKYRAFFGDERFEGLPHEWTEGGGVKLKLGDNPWLLEDEKRRAAEKALGELTFASYGENKKENEHVIPWPELLEGEWIAEHQRREAAGIKPWEFG